MGRLIVHLALLVILTGTAYTQTEWREVSRAELEAKAPLVEPDADAEAIFWEIRLDNQKRKRLSYDHYVRVKIFTERGREKFAKFDIPFAKGKTVEDVAARVIKPDGSVVNLSPGDVFERDLFKAGRIAVRAKSFAVPGIEPGVIVEYRYRETFKGDSADNERLIFQREIPIRRITYYVRPTKGRPMRVGWRNMPDGRFVDAGDGFMSASAENVPALREEPQMPPDDEVRQWAMINYSDVFFSWRNVGNGYGYFFENAVRVDKEIQFKADELTASISEPEKKLRVLFEFCQTKVRNLSYDKTMSEEQKEDIENKRASDTLKRGMGFAADIDLLFAALARAAGFQVDLVMAGDRSETFLDPKKTANPRAIHWTGVLVTGIEPPVMCNPGTPFMPYGIADWYEEGVTAMIANGNGYRWVTTPLTAHGKNVSKRSAKLKLLADGALEGFVRVEHFGHQATSRRRGLFERSPTEREESISNSWKQSWPSAEITGFSLENFADSAKPYTYSFNVRIPNYAQRTGKRMFFQPNVFEFGTPPLFSSATRKHNIYFHYSWSEDDTVEIELPPGFDPDSILEPKEINESKGIGRLTNYYEYDKEKRVLTLSRKFFFGEGGRLNFPAAAYEPLKRLFDLFHSADAHSVSLLQKSP
jgi:hypothetical protein